jgi:capsular exopolysaccharide synthesis family protein
MPNQFADNEGTPPHVLEKQVDADVKGFVIDYRRLWETTKKYLWLIILYVIAAVVAAVVYLSNATPIYKSVARVKVEQRVMDATPTVTGSNTEEDLRGLEMLQTIQLGFVSQSLMQRMTERMNLKNRPDFVKSTGLDLELSDGAISGYLFAHTKTDLITGTRLLTISFEHPDPHVAQEVVDTLIREYVALEGEQRLAAASVNLSYLLEEKKSLENKLENSRNELVLYTRKLGSVSVDGEMNIIAGQLMELNTRLGTAKADRMRLANDNEEIEKVHDNPEELLQISSVAQLTEVTTLRSQLNALDADLSKARLKYKKDNPSLQQLESQRASLQDALNTELLRAPKVIARNYQSAIQNEDALQKATSEQEKKVIDIKADSIESDKLKGEIEADNVSYQAVLRKLNEETSQARSQAVFIQVVDPASPGFKVKPQPVQILAIAIFLAISISAGTIFLLTSLDTSFKAVDELESVLGLSVLAAVPLYESKPKKNEKAQLQVNVPLLEDPFSAASEAYRTLRASLLMLEGDSKSIMVTSAVPEEGKSTTSLSLAVAMAQRGARTLLVEFDLRKPVLERRLFGTHEHLGVADFLTDKADFDSVVQETGIPNLSIISAGKVTRSSGELVLRRARVERLFELAKSKYDQIIVDSAPLLAVSDSLTLAKHFSVIHLVVRSHRTPRRMVKRGLDLLKRVKRIPAGVTLSMVPPGTDYYYYGYSEDGKAYGASHVESDEK